MYAGGGHARTREQLDELASERFRPCPLFEAEQFLGQPQADEGGVTEHLQSFELLRGGVKRGNRRQIAAAKLAEGQCPRAANRLRLHPQAAVASHGVAGDRRTVRVIAEPVAAFSQVREAPGELACGFLLRIGERFEDQPCLS